MAHLETTFAGLTLKNPLIISSSGLTDSAEKIKSLEEAGAAAVVLKSVFEEQIQLHTHTLHDHGSSEAAAYMEAYARSHELHTHIRLVEDAKRACSIPVIASINCYNDDEWIDFARLMQDAGADALELNILSLQTAKDYTPGAFEQEHINILRHIKKTVSIPIIMKLGSNFTNPVALINQLHANGVAGVVLFNRFYQPDIDIDHLSLTSAHVMSSPDELASRLRWTAIASAAIPQTDYAISGGVHDGKALVKAILSGASAVEVCTTIYQHGPQVIPSMLAEISQWMDTKGFDKLSQFQGKMNARSTGDVNPFERTQFVKYYSEHDNYHN